MSVMIKGGTGNNLAAVDSSGNLAVAVANAAPLSVTASTPLPVSASGTFGVTASAPLPVSASAPLPVSASGGSFAVTASGGSLPVTASGGSLAVTAAATLPVSAAGGSFTVLPGATFPVTAAATLPVSITDTARTSVLLSGTSLAVGATGAETALSLQMARGTAISTGTSFVIGNGKSLRVQALVLTSVGNATATAYQMTVRMRYNAAGAVTTASTPVLLPVRLSSPASAYGYCQAVVPIPDEWWLPTGDGVAQFGFTVNATYAINAPTVDVQLIGFEL